MSKTVRQTDGTQKVTHFHYNQANQLIAETSERGEAINEYLYMGSERIARVDYQFGDAGQLAAQLIFIHNDHLGSPRLMTDQDRRVVWTSNTMPFGQSLAEVSDGQNLKFPGQYFDGETGYAYNYFRDYDASLGRYIQSDPIGLLGGVNTFGYVLGNPVYIRDITGTTAEDVVNAYSVVRSDFPGLSPEVSFYSNRLQSNPGFTVNSTTVALNSRYYGDLAPQLKFELRMTVFHELLHVDAINNLGLSSYVSSEFNESIIGGKGTFTDRHTEIYINEWSYEDFLKGIERRSKPDLDELSWRKKSCD
ncbi:MAG TPA: hypothetical protein ENJ60_16185 [Aeromonadales bacterium]|nr:hypothetical protein [Aeromonadales bacterium]